MMSHRAICVCALVCMYQVGAVTKLTAGSDLPLEKAVLSDLYLRKGNPSTKYPQPRGQETKCSTRHKRSDPRPRNAFKNSVSNSINHVNSDMTAVGLWKRYDGQYNKGWNHAKIANTGQAKGLVKMAADGRQPKDYVWNEDSPPKLVAFACDAMGSSYKSNLLSAYNTMKKSCSNINTCKHDNYVSIPCGENNNNVFSPGLNQLWIILDQWRSRLHTHVVVGAQADDSSVAYYIGQGIGGYLTKMSFSFTSFSQPDNPLTFTLGVNTDSGGLANLKMVITHARGNGGVYITVQWSCAYGGVSGWKDRWSSWKWGWAEVAKEFELFCDKATQIYDICHCYVHAYQYIQCTLNTGENDVWQASIGLFGDSLIQALLVNDGLWSSKPRKYSSSSSWQCWT